MKEKSELTAKRYRLQQVLDDLRYFYKVRDAGFLNPDKYVNVIPKIVAREIELHDIRSYLNDQQAYGPLIVLVDPSEHE